MNNFDFFELDSLQRKILLNLEHNESLFYFF